MALRDKIKWDKKYKQTPILLQDRAPSKKLVHALCFTQGKNALDIACGAGKHATYLAKQGFNVDAMDISQVALDILNQKNLDNITTHLVDLEGFIPKENFYDLIVKTNYLDKTLIPALTKALKKEGILFIETYMDHPSNNKPNSNPDFLLQKEELKTFFDDSFEILDYEEFDNEAYEIYKMRKQAITVKKL